MYRGTMDIATMSLAAIDSKTMDPQNGLHNIRPAKWNPQTLDLATINSATMHLAKIVHSTMVLATTDLETMDTMDTQQIWTLQQCTTQNWIT